MSLTGKTMKLGYVLVLGLLTANAGLTVHHLRAVFDGYPSIGRAATVIGESRQVLSELTDAETGQRGYLLTGDPTYLEPFRAASRDLGGSIPRLSRRTAGDAAQAPRVAELGRVAGAKMEELRETIRLHETEGPGAAIRTVRLGLGRRLMDEARRVVTEMGVEERGRIEGNFASIRSAARWAVVNFALATATAVALLLNVGHARRRERVERARGAEAVRRNEVWLRTTLTSMGEAAVVTDGRARVRLMNPIAEALTGWSQGEAEGRPFAEVFRIVHEQTREPAADPVAEVLRDGLTIAMANHTALIARDGTETPIEDSAAPIKGDDGSVDGVILVFRDVTGARRRREDLKDSLSRFRQLADAMPQIVWASGPDGSLEYVNERWYETTGLPRGAEGGSGWESVYHPDDLAGCKALWSASVRAGEPYESEYRLRDRRAGDYRWHLGRAVPARDEAGRVVRWYGTATDIDDRKRAEEEVKAARDEAENANRAKDQFLAVLSHELRTPLNPILMAVTAMLDAPAPPADVRPELEMIKQNVTLQARLIDDLLDVMRIVRGKMHLRWGVADCHALIDQAVRVCRSEVFGRGVRLELDLAARDHHVNADAARLQQVFWNLIKNAVKFTPDGGRLTVRSRNAGRDGGALVVEFADTGIGISPEVLPAIFDPFQQGEATITRRFGGLGLGLAISRSIVEAHGGSLAAESPGKGLGATFRVELKALTAQAAEAEPAPPGGGEPAPAEAARVANPLGILVVEDEVSTARLMSRLLGGLGHEVRTAHSFVEAMRAVDDTDFDLIISDIGLPDGSGLDLMRRVKSRNHSVAAIALTGYGMEEDIVRSREAGFTAHMIKPIDFTRLEAMIRQLVV